ncbi:PLDc N-terminal domain-containing protein [Oleiharenicola sp. Vm1]|uniref:PLDc N-terminal domain-containing protein n=1 Tax=Oleiharenicola sp. Vm1 TaxID=3398393 RepID=UPI0039F4F882
MDPSLEQAVDTARQHPWIFGVLPHVLTVLGFLLAFFAIARLMSERKQPGNTFAWLLAIAFVPYLGVPLFLLLGGRKLRRLAATKARLCPIVPGVPPPPPPRPSPRACSRSTAPARP